jgi:tRNA threonylcarbamoyladenosine biosynthesis protein TsaE
MSKSHIKYSSEGRVMSESFILNSEEEMTLVAGQLATKIQKGDIIFLHGNLGAGKTTLTRALLRALGFEGRVKSPTFTVMEPYDLTHLHGFFLYHYDLYRISGESPDELENIGIRDQLNQKDVLVIEWPERLKSFRSFLRLEPTIEVFIDFCELPQDAPQKNPAEMTVPRKICLNILK